MKAILPALLVTQILISCSKVVDPVVLQDPAGNNLLFPNGLPAANTSANNSYILIYCSQSADIFNPDSSYGIFAYARFKSNGVSRNTGPLKINGRSIPAGSNNEYFFNYVEEGKLSEGKALLGSNIKIEAKGAGWGQSEAISSVVLAPKELYPSIQLYPPSVFSRTKVLPLRWAADPDNQSKQVSVQISYYKALSQSHVPGLPDQIPDIYYPVADNGAFDVPVSDLMRFPAGSYVDISLYRQSYAKSAGGYDIFIVHEASTHPTLVTE